VRLFRGLADDDREAQVEAYRRWGFKGLNDDLVDVLNVWARFIYGPLLDDRVRSVADGVAPGQYGRAEAFLDTTPTIPTALLGLVRETARQAVAEAVDAFDPAAILVLHAGIFADLAVETGVPVVIHVGPTDLAAAGLDERVHDLVVAALGSAELLIGADEATLATLKSQWLGEAEACENRAGPIDDHCAGWLAEAVRIACRRRGG
jgi:hypothetical protein